MDDIQNDENKNLIDDHVEATTGMEEIDGFDFERAAQLMGIIEKCANVGVKSTSISGIAQAALNEMNEEAKAIAKRRAEAMANLERKRDEALAAQRQQQEEDEHAQQEAASSEAASLSMHPRPPVASGARAIPAPPADGRRL